MTKRSNRVEDALSTTLRGHISEPDPGSNGPINISQTPEEMGSTFNADDDRPVSKPRTIGSGRESARAQGHRGEAEFGFPERSAKSIPTAAARLDQPLLDAWHATYSGSYTTSKLRQHGVSESIIETILSSGDDRVEVDNTRLAPWRWICSLIITAADGSQWVGSGWLAGPSTIITAGHCVYIHGRGGWAERVDVYPGRHGTSTTLSFSSSDLRSVEGWTQGQTEECDYGAVILPRPASGFGFFGFQSMTDADLRMLTVNVFGYPADKTPGTLWGHTRVLEQVQPRMLVYDISTFGGQSGCPVYFKDGDRRYVVGIHNYGDVSGNSGTRVTDQVFDNIVKWKAETEDD